MEAYAVVATGGKQYRVEKGNVLDVERLDAEVGKTIKLDEVLAVSDGSTLSVGAPTIAGSSVTVKIVDHFRGKKLISFKKKRRKGYTRKVGHRQELTRLEVVDFGAAKKASAKKAAPAKDVEGEGDGA